jgi:hypothetical protein
MHFHPLQEEYIQVLAGRLCVEQQTNHGGVIVLTPADGELCVKPWVHHRLYPAPEDLVEADNKKPVRFLLSGQETPEVFRLDTLFFENWYGYQDEIVVKGEPASLIQIMMVFHPPYLSYEEEIGLIKSDVRRGRLLSFFTMVDSLWTHCVYGTGDRGRALDRRTFGLSTVL